MRREFPERPFVGVGAVVFRDESVLLVRRDKEPGKGQWSLPGGAVEVGETMIDALKRELKEEVSVSIECGGLVDVFDRIFLNEDGRVLYHYVLIDYWGWFQSGSPSAGSDISDARLVNVQDMGGLEISGDVKSTIRKACRLREAGLSL